MRGLFWIAAGLFAILMILFPKKIWRIFYGNFSPGTEPNKKLLWAYRVVGILALVVLIWKWVT